MNLPARLAATTFLLACAMPAQAQQDAAEQRLRDQLRQTTLDLRQAQDDNADLKSKLDALSQKPAAPPPEAKKADDANSRELKRALGSETAKAAALQQQLDDSRKALAELQQSYQQSMELARSRDAEEKKYEALYGETGGHLKTCEADNGKLVQIGEELIERYKNKGVFDAMGDNEPLTGLHRVELEQAAQTYHAKLRDAELPPATAPAPVK